jgi:transposase-like protein
VPKRRYSDEEKAAALATLDANGGNIAETQRQIGIPYRTLANWAAEERNGTMHEDVANLGNIKKIDLAQRLEEIARELADAMPDKIERANLQQVATSMAIAIDKMQLLRGAPTSITDISIEQRAERIERMTEDERAVLAHQLGAGDTEPEET